MKWCSWSENIVALWQIATVALGSKAFGRANMESKEERLMRFYEEATELVQSGGLSEAKADTIRKYVYSRPVEPELHKEVGGVQLTLFSLAEAHGLNVYTAFTTEYNRVESKLDICAEKHRNKPAEVRAA